MDGSEGGMQSQHTKPGLVGWRLDLPPGRDRTGRQEEGVAGGASADKDGSCEEGLVKEKDTY